MKNGEMLAWSMILAALLSWMLVTVSTRAEVTEPLPATVCYQTDGIRAHVSWMALGRLEARYVTNRTAVLTEGKTTVLRHELVLRPVWRVYMPRVEQ